MIIKIRKILRRACDLLGFCFERYIKVFLWYIFRVFPINENKIVICNFNGRGYADNTKYIAEELRKNSKYDIVWMIGNQNDTVNLPETFRTVKIYSVAMIYEMVTAKYWINNVRLNFEARKRKNQKYIQTWHGSFGGKKSEGEVEDKLDKRYLRLAKVDSKFADLFLSNSKKASEHYREFYWYNGEILECGFPRNDIMFTNNDELRRTVRNRLEVKDDEKIVLYAPTFRDDGRMNCYDIDVRGIVEALKRKTGESYKVVYRLHPNLVGGKVKFDFPKEVIDASKYPDMQELLFASDILITDYSSSYLDFMLMDRTVFFYMPDYEEFMAERAFQFDLTKLFIPCAFNNYELIEAIEEFDREKYILECHEFKTEYGFLDDGTASRRVVEWIANN